MLNKKIVKFLNEKIGIYFCIFSLILITISFAFLPLSTYYGFEAGFHPLFPVLIIGLSLVGLSLTFLHKKIGIRVGPLGYIIPILLTGPVYLGGYEPRTGIPTNPSYFRWEIGMHLIVIGLILQYMGSLLISTKKSKKNIEKMLMKEEDHDVVIGYKEVIIGMLKEFTIGLIVLTIFIVIIFIILIPLKAFYII